MDTEARASHRETFRMTNSFHKACPEREAGVLLPLDTAKGNNIPKVMAFIYLAAQGVG